MFVVLSSGHEYRRVKGTWQMLGSLGEWFDCELQNHVDKMQVDDYEFCLRSYTLDEGPSPYKGRRKFEDLSDFVMRKQIENLRADCKNIFAPVNVGPHDPTAETRRRIASAARVKWTPKLSAHLTV